MALGYLLARRGLRATVLEKHVDFLRDFRGDTIHPSTITVLRDLGLAERFLDLRLTRVPTMGAVVDGTRFTTVDFSTLPGPDDFLVSAPPVRKAISRSGRPSPSPQTGAPPCSD